jgi:hypothetical protein
LDLLKTQVVLKGLMTEEDWNRISPDITFRFNQDSYFTELKNNDILAERLNIIAAVTPYIGKFFSEEFVRKNFLKQSEEDILEIDAQINREAQRQLEAQEQQAYQQMLTGQQPTDQQNQEEAPPQ